ncbi:unnamed protein product [Danaus chrysippus]|uniref:(African queen) hypothetical protein n=1 Tax=Danaus chrysippus TaxID=151541 RepID=A0A8J2W2E7_9NEOP|nr:unnamed protein product [Danaus chrysippus]
MLLITTADMKCVGLEQSRFDSSPPAGLTAAVCSGCITSLVFLLTDNICGVKLICAIRDSLSVSMTSILASCYVCMNLQTYQLENLLIIPMFHPVYKNKLARILSIPICINQISRLSIKFPVFRRAGRRLKLRRRQMHLKNIINALAL